MRTRKHAFNSHISTNFQLLSTSCESLISTSGPGNAQQKASEGWGTAKWIIDQVVMDGHCEQVPYECIALIGHRLDTTSVKYCFDECLREGQMNARVGW